MGEQELQQATDKINDILKSVPQPDQLINILSRDLKQDEISELVNDGKRGSIYAWKKGHRQPGWESYVRLLYAAGYKIVKREGE